MAMYHEYKYISDKTFGEKPFCTPYATIKTIIDHNPENQTYERVKIRMEPVLSEYLGELLLSHLVVIVVIRIA